MYVVDVSPIQKGISLQVLSYFCGQNVLPGTIVTVPLRKKTIQALTLDCQPLSARKQELRENSFTLEKVISIDEPSIPPPLIQAFQSSADYHAVSLGSLLHAGIPGFFWNLPNFKSIATTKITQKKPAYHYGPWKMQTDYIEEVIAKNLKASKSTIIICPSRQYVEKIHEELTHSLDDVNKDQLFAFPQITGSLKQQRSWEDAESLLRPVIIIGTSSTLILRRFDIGSHIMMEPSAPGWRRMSRPRIDLRHLATGVSKYLGSKLHYVDFSPSLELQNKDTSMHTWEKPRIIDMQKVKENAGSFTLFSKHTTGLLEKHTDTLPIVLFVPRRGLAPITVCQDCNKTVVCTECDHLVVLHKTSKGNQYHCHYCHSLRSADMSCIHCNSWRLKPYGIGTDTVVEAVKQINPDLNTVTLDRDHASSHRKLETYIQSANSIPGSVLIITELALPYISQANQCIVVSLDSLLVRPSLHLETHIRRTLSHLTDISKKPLIIQTKDPRNTILDAFSTNTWSELATTILKEKKSLQLGDTAVRIIVLFSGSQYAVEKDITATTSSLSDYSPRRLPNHKKGPKRFVGRILITTPAATWPEQGLLSVLHNLPPGAEVIVNSDTLL